MGGGAAIYSATIFQATPPNPLSSSTLPFFSARNLGGKDAFYSTPHSQQSDPKTSAADSTTADGRDARRRRPPPRCPAPSSRPLPPAPLDPHPPLLPPQPTSRSQPPRRPPARPGALRSTTAALRGREAVAAAAQVPPEPAGRAESGSRRRSPGPSTQRASTQTPSADRRAPGRAHTHARPRAPTDPARAPTRMPAGVREARLDGERGVPDERLRTRI